VSEASGPFYEFSDGSYLPSELTRGPWDPEAQHAGPPAALIGREIEGLNGGRLGGGEGDPAQVGRITYEILRPVPIAPLRVEAEVVRGGRSVELVEAALSHADEVVIRARGWRLRRKAVELDPQPVAEAPPPGPGEAGPEPFFITGEEVGYQTAMDFRFVSGAFLEPGPAIVWGRMRGALIDSEEPSPLTRVLVVADSGNGVSAALDWRRYLFINVDLSVHLNRMPQGEWVCLDAVTRPEPNGIGISDTLLLDERGPIGRAAQTLLVDRRD
jgi:Thioesterase-like superfamily